MWLCSNLSGFSGLRCACICALPCVGVHTRVSTWRPEVKVRWYSSSSILDFRWTLPAGPGACPLRLAGWPASTEILILCLPSTGITSTPHYAQLLHRPWRLNMCPLACVANTSPTEPPPPRPYPSPTAAMFFQVALVVKATKLRLI